MRNKNVLYLVHGAAIAAIYVALTVLTEPISFLLIQFRISEALTILPFFTPAAVPGLFIGCLLANFFCGAPIWDIVFGSLATLIGAAGSYLLRRHRALVCLPPILSNALIIPFVLRYAYGFPESIFFQMFSVGTSEILAVGVLGNLLLAALYPHRKTIFGSSAFSDADASAESAPSSGGRAGLKKIVR